MIGHRVGWDRAGQNLQGRNPRLEAELRPQEWIRQQGTY